MAVDWAQSIRDLGRSLARRMARGLGGALRIAAILALPRPVPPAGVARFAAAPAANLLAPPRPVPPPEIARFVAPPAAILALPRTVPPAGVARFVAPPAATLLAPPRQVPPPVPLPAGFEPIVPGGRSPGRCGVCLGPEPPDVRHAVRGCGQPLHRACLAGRARGRCPGPCGMRASYG